MLKPSLLLLYKDRDDLNEWMHNLYERYGTFKILSSPKNVNIKIEFLNIVINAYSLYFDGRCFGRTDFLLITPKADDIIDKDKKDLIKCYADGLYNFGFYLGFDRENYKEFKNKNWTELAINN